jgi:NACalpha-BTF3-like transcription factor
MAKPKSLNEVVGGERYRTSLSRLLADDGEGTYLLRALNSNYFVQHEGDQDTIDVVPEEKAVEVFQGLPNKHQSLIAAFPRSQGGIGLATETIATSREDEDEAGKSTAVVTGEKIKAVRDETRAGSLDCRKALEATDGDVEGAIQYLRDRKIGTPKHVWT